MCSSLNIQRVPKLRTPFFVWNISLSRCWDVHTFLRIFQQGTRVFSFCNWKRVCIFREISQETRAKVLHVWGGSLIWNYRIIYDRFLICKCCVLFVFVSYNKWICPREKLAFRTDRKKLFRTCKSIGKFSGEISFRNICSIFSPSFKMKKFRFRRLIASEKFPARFPRDKLYRSIRILF